MNSHNEQAGLSLFEVLITILIMSITLLGFVKMQSVLLADLMKAKQFSQAQRTAFQILDVYPQPLPSSIPDGWQYQIVKTQQNIACYEVKVVILPLFGNDITQKRWFCQHTTQL